MPTFRQIRKNLHYFTTVRPGIPNKEEVHHPLLFGYSLAQARALPRNGWGNQPTIHRRWFGSKHHPLSIQASEIANTPKYNELWTRRSPKKLNLLSISDFFFYSLACSSRKEPGSGTILQTKKIELLTFSCDAPSEFLVEALQRFQRWTAPGRMPHHRSTVGTRIWCPLSGVRSFFFQPGF
jgi:hypothetical protein